LKACQPVEEGRELLPERRQPGRPGERLVEAVGGQDHVGPAEGKVLLEVGEVVGPGSEIDFVGRPGERADDQFLVGKGRVEHGRHVAEQGRPLEQRVADEADMVAPAEFERQRRRDRLAGRRPGGAVEVEAILGEVLLLGGRRERRGGNEEYGRQHNQTVRDHQVSPGLRPNSGRGHLARGSRPRGVTRAISSDARPGDCPRTGTVPFWIGILPALVRKAGSIGTGDPSLHPWVRRNSSRGHLARGIRPHIRRPFGGQDARRHSRMIGADRLA
jgi:hypothetical protein